MAKAADTDLEKAAKLLDAWTKRSVCSLAVGEMSMAEWRLVKAILVNRAEAIRELKG